MPNPLSPKQIRDLARTLGTTAQTLARYAMAPTKRGWMRGTLDRLFGPGREIDPESGASERETEAFLRRMSAVEQRMGAPPVIVPPQNAPRQPAPPGTVPPPSAPPTNRIGSRLQPPSGPKAPPLPGESSPFGEEILATSSNVYSFSYDPHSSTLYVTYKAPLVSSDHVAHGRRKYGGKLSQRQLVGKSGAIKGKSNSRGAMYAYYDVPARVYTRMKLASSKGKFVWDELRIRGSMFGHRFRYGLVQGAVISQKGISGTYIPRRATNKGFRTRSVANAGRGQRGFSTSTLPQQSGFSTRNRRK